MEMNESLSNLFSAYSEAVDSRFEYTTSLRQYMGKRVMFFHLKRGGIDIVISNSRCNEIGRARINDKIYSEKPENNEEAVLWACKIARVAV